MPEGTGDAGRQAAMPLGGAAEDCHPSCGQGRRLGAYLTPLSCCENRASHCGRVLEGSWCKVLSLHEPLYVRYSHPLSFPQGEGV